MTEAATTTNPVEAAIEALLDAVLAAYKVQAFDRDEVNERLELIEQLQAL